MVKEMVQSNPLSDYEEILPETMFYRIHRSYLINCAQIKKILNSEAGQVLMNDEKHLPVSRRRYPLLIDFLKNNDF
jgi:two-component system LytT family response regulator